MTRRLPATLQLPRALAEELPWRQMVSSNVRRVAFVPSGEAGAQRVRAKDALGSLYVEFSTGSIYHYDDVAPASVDALVEADADPALSVGSTVHSVIKPNYECARVAIIDPDTETP